MPASLEHISGDTPMGANLTDGGATFRVWAPNAHRVHACVNGAEPKDANLLTRDERGHWRGFLPGVQDRDRYKYFVVGDGGSGPKRDPFARELATPFPSDCVIRKTDFPWHETGYVTPAFHDFVIYQLHVGVFFTPNLPAQGGDVSRCGAQDSVSLQPRGHGDPAPADPGVRHSVQSRLQRGRLFFSRDGFRGRGCGPASVCRPCKCAARRQGPRRPTRSPICAAR